MQDMGFIDYSLLLSIRKIETSNSSEVISNPEAGDLLNHMSTSVKNKESLTDKNFEMIQSIYKESLSKNSGKSKEDFRFSEVADVD